MDEDEFSDLELWKQMAKERECSHNWEVFLESKRTDHSGETAKVITYKCSACGAFKETKEIIRKPSDKDIARWAMR